jgi:hypothetical protein
MPFIAALIGIRLAEAPALPLVFAASALLLAVIPFVAAILPSALVHGTLKSLSVPVTGVLPLAAMFAVVAAACWRAESRGRRTISTGLVVGSTVACVAALKIFTYPALDQHASARQLWRSIESTGRPACAPEVERSMRDGLNFYAGYLLPDCSGGRNRAGTNYNNVYRD